MKKLTTASLVLCLTCIASEASADEWYGYQTLASDLVTGGVVYLLMEGHTKMAPIYVGVAGYLGGPFLIHMLHDEPYRALGSAGVRLAAPTLGALAGWAMRSKEPGSAGEWAPLIGVAVGLVVASAIDGAAIAWKTNDEPPSSSTAQPLRTFSIGGSF